MNPNPSPCEAGLRGCTRSPDVRLHCVTEDKDITICLSCSGIWRYNATAQDLYVRCPNCASWGPGTRLHRDSPAAPLILTGPAADAIDHAMEAEAVAIGTITRVLNNLARNSSWLTYATQPMADEDDYT